MNATTQEHHEPAHGEDVPQAGDMLIVEDDPLVAQLLASIVAVHGCASTVLSSAFGVREAVQRRPPGGSPD